MFCYQCEQRAGNGCTKMGVCGKDPETSNMQDLLLHAVKGISQYAHKADMMGKRSSDIDVFVIKALFTTITNVNFDSAKLLAQVREAIRLRDSARDMYESACTETGREPEAVEGPASWEFGTTDEDLISQSQNVGLGKDIEVYGKTVAGLHHLILFGLKGAAAYVDHAHILGFDDDVIYADFHRLIDYIASGPRDIDDLTAKALETGELNFRVMELLDAANTGKYGHPVPTQVRVTPVSGKAILVSGHDLKDLHDLLVQTEGKGINIYTHGEMLPCHGYPELKKFSHLAGNYGGAWQDQQKEFDEFPGAILMTTNCIQKPRDSYKDRIFTTGLVEWPGVTHVENGDFSKVIECALKEEGFAEDSPEKTIMVGFGHNAVMGVAGQVIDAVKNGDISHFFLIGGCDGAKSGRNYYTEFAEKVPDDAVILTLACGKYRFNKLEFGDIGGIPRLLDIGQCNDAYSAIKIALTLADAFETDVNSLPLSLILSWYEQKAVAILLTLLHLGIKNMRLGPTLPEFVDQPVLEALVANFNLQPTTTVDEDLHACLGYVPA